MDYSINPRYEAESSVGTCARGSLLVKVLKPRIVVELGTHGVSLFAFCEYC